MTVYIHHSLSSTSLTIDFYIINKEEIINELKILFPDARVTYSIIKIDYYQYNYDKNKNKNKIEPQPTTNKDYIIIDWT